MRLKKLIKQLKKFNGDSQVSFIFTSPKSYEFRNGRNFDLLLEKVVQINNSDPVVEIVFQNDIGGKTFYGHQ